MAPRLSGKATGQRREYIQPSFGARSGSMTQPSFFWHDYETFGVNPRRDRPAQFAGVRTDLDLNQIEAPVMHYCKPAPDILPEPEACLLTAILPQMCLDKGLNEAAFADAVLLHLAQPGTVGVG
mgnify:CR=1 FL=1